MNRRGQPPIDITLAGDAERVRREHDRKLRELGDVERPVVLADILLANAVNTPVSHGLGRAPKIVKVGVPRGATAAGYIVEVRDGTVDRRRQVLLKATGYGATITVDVEVL